MIKKIPKDRHNKKVVTIQVKKVKHRELLILDESKEIVEEGLESDNANVVKYAIVSSLSLGDRNSTEKLFEKYSKLVKKGDWELEAVDEIIKNFALVNGIIHSYGFIGTLHDFYYSTRRNRRQRYDIIKIQLKTQIKSKKIVNYLLEKRWELCENLLASLVVPNAKQKQRPEVMWTGA